MTTPEKRSKKTSKRKQFDESPFQRYNLTIMKERTKKGLVKTFYLIAAVILILGMILPAAILLFTGL